MVLLQAQIVWGISLTINGGTGNRFQTLDGFGVNINSANWHLASDTNGELRPALDMLVDQLGANIFRVIIDNADWEATNDNADPYSFNWTYYNSVYTTPKWERLWATVAYLNQKGIVSGLMLNFMGPVAGWMGGGNHIDASHEVGGPTANKCGRLFPPTKEWLKLNWPRSPRIWPPIKTVRL